MNPADICLLYVEGESMEPTLRPGDMIVINHNDNSINREGIYVLRMDDTLLVKRLQRLPGGIIKVSSDNPAYEPFELKAENMGDNELAIIGRVI